MKIRNEWMTDELYFGENYPNNIILEDAIRRFEAQRDESLEGRDAEVDGNDERIVVQSHTSIGNRTRYDKKIHCNLSSQVHVGSIVKFDDKIWMVVSKVFDNLAYKTTSVMECNNSIGAIPVIIESQVRLYAMGIWDEKYFPVPESDIVMMMPDMDEAKAIKRNDVFKLSEQDNYKIIDLNRVIMPGIIVAKLEWTAQEPISPSPPSPDLPVSGYEILGIDEIKYGQTITYTAKKYVDKEEVPAKFTFTIVADSVPDSAYTLTATADNQCKIKCNNYVYNIILRAAEDENNFIEKQIKLKSFL